MLSMATDYEPGIHDFKSMADMQNGVGNPQRYLKAIADQGFSHVHWCHHWSGDFIYDEYEMAHIGRLLDEYGLQVADVHGSEGREKFSYSPQEYARLAGVDLVKNRVDFCARFGGDAVCALFLGDPCGGHCGQTQARNQAGKFHFHLHQVLAAAGLSEKPAS